jgi:hypothetical protein
MVIALAWPLTGPFGLDGDDGPRRLAALRVLPSLVTLCWFGITSWPPARRLECWGSAAAARILHSQPREISSRSLPSPAVYSQHTQRTQPRCGVQVARFNTPYTKSSRYTTRTRLSLSRSDPSSRLRKLWRLNRTNDKNHHSRD